jgi:hypothetical protein
VLIYEYLIIELENKARNLINKACDLANKFEISKIKECEEK